MAEAGLARDRRESAKALRHVVPRSAHAAWSPDPSRPDPVAIVLAQDATRIPRLVPVRHERMAQSAFAFYRGTAAIMAADLSRTLDVGLRVQLCGDAHLTNFGTFATPERQQVFDITDFDETMPGPFEWDVKRLAASMVLAARDRELDDELGRALAARSTSAYAQGVRELSRQSALEVWYAQLELEEVAELADSKRFRRGVEELGARARRRTSERALGKLTEMVDGRRQFRTEPPLLMRLRDLDPAFEPDRLANHVETSYAAYLDSLAPNRRHLMARFRLLDAALKVVGVGSAGTRCLVVLLEGVDHREPLLLQMKEANHSVLEPYVGESGFDHQGQRVVHGQRLIHAAGDIFLGYSRVEALHDFYWRQLADQKGSVEVQEISVDALGGYAALCGWTLAHAHARSGDAASIAGYLGSGQSFARAVGAFAVAYADQATEDHARFVEAIAEGRIEAGESGLVRAS